MDWLTARCVTAGLRRHCHEAAIRSAGAGGRCFGHRGDRLAFWLECAADHINALAAKKKEKAEKTIQPVEEKAAAATAEGKVIYRTITRDVVKYVQSPDRTVCQFGDAAVQLRQRAIDAANSISGFDAGAVSGK